MRILIAMERGIKRGSTANNITAIIIDLLTLLAKLTFLKTDNNLYPFSTLPEPSLLPLIESGSAAVQDVLDIIKMSSKTLLSIASLGVPSKAISPFNKP